MLVAIILNQSPPYIKKIFCPWNQLLIMLFARLSGKPIHFSSEALCCCRNAFQVFDFYETSPRFPGDFHLLGDSTYNYFGFFQNELALSKPASTIWNIYFGKT